MGNKHVRFSVKRSSINRALRSVSNEVEGLEPDDGTIVPLVCIGELRWKEGGGR